MTSCNLTGFGLAAQNYLKTLLLFSDVLCVQEHFLLDHKDKKHSNTKKLVNILGSSHDMYIVPACKSNKQVTRGQGGLVTLWRKGLTKYVTKVDCSNFRLRATKFSFESSQLLVVNAYLPCDPRVDNFDDTELVNLLADLKNVLESSNCFNIIIAADLNSDFSWNTRFTSIVEESLENLNLKIFWEDSDNSNIQPVDYTFMAEVNNVVTTSTIDQFSSINLLYDCVIEAGVIHCAENLSNHSAIYAKLCLGENQN